MSHWWHLKRLLAGWVIAVWLSCPLSVSQHGQLSFPFLQVQLMSSNPCKSGLQKQTAADMVKDVGEGYKTSHQPSDASTQIENILK